MILSLQGLTKTYGGKKALDGISLTVEKGEILGLLGPNGAGKSTTMNIVTGCLAATSGTALVDGYDIAREPNKAKKQVGYLPEIPPLYPDMRVLEYLEFIYKLKGVSLPKAQHLADICKQVGLENEGKRIIGNLSKGYRQRVGFAGALVGEPPLLILDEPTVGLDPTQIIEIRRLIQALSKDRTVILSSHILSEIEAVCSRVVVLSHGRIVADDTPANLRETLNAGRGLVLEVEGAQKAVQKALARVEGVTRLDVTPLEGTKLCRCKLAVPPKTDVRREVFFALSEAGLPLLSSAADTATLEDVFLQLLQTDSKGGGGV